MGRSKVGREYGYAFGWRRSAKFLGVLLLAMPVLTSCKLVSVRRSILPRERSSTSKCKR